MSASAKYDALVDELSRQYRFFKVVPKQQSPLMKVLAYFARHLAADWMQSFSLTLGYRVYMPEDLLGTDAGYRVLFHERQHIRDFSPWFALSYLLLLPLGPSVRAYWEFRGYREAMRVWLQDFGQIPDDLLDFISWQFTGSNYGWMWPFKKDIRRRLEAARQQLLAERK